MQAIALLPSMVPWFTCALHLLMPNLDSQTALIYNFLFSVLQ
jgi:hypothetical protein